MKLTANPVARVYTVRDAMQSARDQLARHSQAAQRLRQAAAEERQRIEAATLRAHPQIGVLQDAKGRRFYTFAGGYRESRDVFDLVGSCDIPAPQVT